MTMFRRLFDVKILVLCLTAFNGWAFATNAPVFAAAVPGQTLGDCFKIVGGKPVASAFVAGPANTVCALPANTCKTKGDCTVEAGAPWVKWTSAIKIGDCSQVLKGGTCNECPDNLTCAIGDKYKSAADCIAAAAGTSTGVRINAVANNNCM
jgi:hypothetical protein